MNLQEQTAAWVAELAPDQTHKHCQEAVLICCFVVDEQEAGNAKRLMLMVWAVAHVYQLGPNRFHNDVHKCHQITVGRA